MKLSQLIELFELDVENGFSEEEVNEAEKRLGIKLPQILRELYLRFGRDDTLNSLNYFVRPNRLEINELGLLTFYIENQGVLYWSIKLDDIQKVTCEVYCDYNGFYIRKEELSIENFLVKLGYHYTNILFPFFYASMIFKQTDEKVIRENYGECKSTTVFPDGAEVKYYWKSIKSLISINYRNEEHRIYIRSKFEEEIIVFQNLVGEREWQQFPDHTNRRKNCERVLRYKEDFEEKGIINNNGIK